MENNKIYSAEDMASANFIATIALYKSLKDKNLIDEKSFEEAIQKGANVLVNNGQLDAANLLKSMFNTLS